MTFIHSIKFRFTLWYLVVLGTVLVLLSAGVYLYLSQKLYDDLDSSLKIRAGQLQNSRVVIDNFEVGSLEEELGEVVVFYVQKNETIYPKSVKAIEDPLANDLSSLEEAFSGNAQYVTVENEKLGELRFLIVPFASRGYVMWSGKPVGMPMQRYYVDSAAIAVGRSTQHIDDTLDGLTTTLVIAVPLTLIIAGAGGVFLAQRALKPVDQIARTALEIEGTDLSQRIKVDTKDELGRLASTLNQMIERLEKAFKRQQQFTGDASHELRTPLAIIEAESTLALERERSTEEYRQSLETVVQETEHMSTIIDQLLALARADAGKEQLTFEEIQLDALLRDVASDADVLCREKGLKCEFGTMEALTVRGDNSRLRQLFLNLLNNSIRYTPGGGTISISLTKEGNQAIASVIDTGIGIPEEDIPLVFERFYRVDKARSRADGGSGLGLAICKHIAEVHGGSVEVESRQGKGSTFSVYLPIA